MLRWPLEEASVGRYCCPAASQFSKTPGVYWDSSLHRQRFEAGCSTTHFAAAAALPSGRAGRKRQHMPQGRTQSLATSRTFQ